MIADIRLLPSVLPDVHLQMGQLQVALGTARVEAHKRLSLLLGFGHDGLCTDELRWLRHLLPDLGNDEGWLRRHGHVDRTGAVVLVRIDRTAVGHDLHGERRWLCVTVVLVHVGGGLDQATGLVDWGEWGGVVLQWHCSYPNSEPVCGHWSVDWSRKLRKLGLLLLWDHCFLQIRNHTNQSQGSSG